MNACAQNRKICWHDFRHSFAGTLNIHGTRNGVHYSPHHHHRHLFSGTTTHQTVALCGAFDVIDAFVCVFFSCKQNMHSTQRETHSLRIWSANCAHKSQPMKTVSYLTATACKHIEYSRMLWFIWAGLLLWFWRRHMEAEWGFPRISFVGGSSTVGTRTYECFSRRVCHCECMWMRASNCDYYINVLRYLHFM